MDIYLKFVEVVLSVSALYCVYRIQFTREIIQFSYYYKFFSNYNKKEICSYKN